MKEKVRNKYAIALGVIAGVILGIAQDNLGLWISLGLAIGVAIHFTIIKESSKK